MKTEKKRGRGRPKKVWSNTNKQTSASTKEFYDIGTNAIVKLSEEGFELQQPKSRFNGDFSILIDNAENGELKINRNGNASFIDTFLANSYLDNQEFRDFINGIVVSAAQKKATRISVELESIVG